MWRVLFPLLLCHCASVLRPPYTSASDGRSPPPTYAAGDGLLYGAVAAGLTAKELSARPAPTTVLGWNVEIAGDRAKFYACEDETTCGTRQIELAANEISAMDVIGRARPQRADHTSYDEDTDVLRLTLRHPLPRTSRGGAVYDENHGLFLGGKGE